MKNIQVLLGLSLLVLLFSGCIKISYDAEQQFKEDGTSVLTVDEYIGLSKESFSSLSSLSSLYGVESESSIALEAMVDYYTSSSYSGFHCSRLVDSAVASCTPNDDGSMTAVFNLAPGDFYAHQSQMDWVNLKETRTYVINKVPMAAYYAVKGTGGDDYSDAVAEDMDRYIEDNLDNYLTKEAYCTADYPFNCEFTSYSPTTANVRLNSSSISPLQVLWAACSDKEALDFYFMNESEARAEVTALELNRTVSSAKPLTLSLSCPAGYKTIVLGYMQQSSYGGSTTSVAALEVITKDEMKQKVLDYLDTLDTSSTSGTAETSYEDYVINFRDGEILGSSFDEFGKLGGVYAEMLTIETSVDYRAVFPNRVTSATIGSEVLTARDDAVSLSEKDLDGLPEGALLVVTEKELSPLGVFTWAIPMVIIVGIAVFLFLLRPKSQP